MQHWLKAATASFTIFQQSFIVKGRCWGCVPLLFYFKTVSPQEALLTGCSLAIPADPQAKISKDSRSAPRWQRQGVFTPYYPRTAGSGSNPFTMFLVLRWATKGCLGGKDKFLLSHPRSHSTPPSPYGDVLRGSIQSICISGMHQCCSVNLGTPISIPRGIVDHFVVLSHKRALRCSLSHSQGGTQVDAACHLPGLLRACGP